MVVSKLEAFEAQHPAIAAWWMDTTFEFALSLREQAARSGHLSDKQIAAALKCVEKLAAARAVAAGRTQTETRSVETGDISHITEAFARARANDVRTPKLRLFAGEQALRFSRAPDHGQNAGAIYVKDQNDIYLGKIAGGVFHPSRDCNDEMRDAVLAACSDPEQAAIAYGQRFGSCSVCGRELTNHTSIDLGIGPICRQRFFG